MRTTTAELERLRKARERDRKTIARLTKDRNAWRDKAQIREQLLRLHGAEFEDCIPKPGMIVPYIPPDPPRRWWQFWR